MGETRNYNPLNEGYSGKVYTKGSEGYTGYINSDKRQVAPQTIKPLQSAIIKPVAPSNQQSGK